MTQNNHHLTGGPAFPGKFVNDSDQNVTAPDGQLVAPRFDVRMMGATVRDLLAAHALQGLCARNWSLPHAPEVLDLAYTMADAGVARRAKFGIQPAKDEPKAQGGGGGITGANLGGAGGGGHGCGTNWTGAGSTGVGYAGGSGGDTYKGGTGGSGAAAQSANTDNAADMKQGADFDPAQLLRDMVAEFGLGDLGPAIDSAGIGGSGRLKEHQLGEHIVIVHDGAHIAGFGFSGKIPKPPTPAVPKGLIPHLQALVDLAIKREGAHRVTCSLCHSVATSFERLAHSDDCQAASAQKMVADLGAK